MPGTRASCTPEFRRQTVDLVRAGRDPDELARDRPPDQACFPVAATARVLGVPKAGTYAWLHRAPSDHAIADTALGYRSPMTYEADMQDVAAKP